METLLIKINEPSKANLLMQMLKSMDFISSIDYLGAQERESQNTNSPTPLPLKRGAGKHLITHIADDFNAPLDDFKDYM